MFFGKHGTISNHAFFRKGGSGALFLKNAVSALENPSVISALSSISPSLATAVSHAKSGGYLERLKHY